VDSGEGVEGDEMSGLFKILLWINFLFGSVGYLLEIILRMFSGDLSRIELETAKGLMAVISIGFLALFYQREEKEK
jgi:hypothetical protein